MWCRNLGALAQILRKCSRRLSEGIDLRIGILVQVDDSEGDFVTVCVAALCNDGTTIFGAADRMLTASDIEFEPQQQKIIALTNSVVVMTAGDSSLQTEILSRVFGEVLARIHADPDNWWRVRDVASLYIQHYNSERARRAEVAVLAPLNLTSDTFIQRQQQMAPTLVNTLVSEMLNLDIPAVETIITGIDPTGAHIYVVSNGNLSCNDVVGFAAIGVGRWHANSQFMFNGHTRNRPVPETLLLAFSAKKRAEVAPGVGEATDIFTIGPGLGTYSPVGEHVIKKLEEIYEANRKRIQRAAKKAEESINEFTNQLAEAATPKAQASSPTGTGAATLDAPAAPEGEPPPA